MLAPRSTSPCLGMPRIVYVSWPATEISGGIKAAFQHVEILTDAGLDAAIASRDTSAPGWFKTDAKILGLEQVGAEDHSRFICTPGKTLQIACVPRKRPNEFRAIADLFRAVYPQHRSLDWVYLHQASEEQVAQVMGLSAVFLSLARLEAHGMTALEAMASGCIVAGYSGVAGGIAGAGAALIRRPAPPAARSRSRSGACSAAARARRSGRCLPPARPASTPWPAAG